MYNRFSAILLSITALNVSASSAPSAEVIINNDSACSLQLSYLQNFTAMLTLPDAIEPYSNASGQIKFDDGLFSTNQQEATGQYILSCDNEKRIISLNFYIGKDHIEEYNYFFEIHSNEPTSILILPFGKTIVTNSLPVMINFIDKERRNDETHEGDAIDDGANTNTKQPTSSSKPTGRNATNYKQI